MAEGIRFFEGFEKDDSLSVWEDTFSFIRETGVKRSGNYGARPGPPFNIGVGQSPLFIPSPEIILGFAFRPAAVETGSLANAIYIAQMVQPPGVGATLLEFTEQRTLGVSTVGGNNHGYTNKSLEEDAFYYVEWYVRIHPTNGASIVRVNGNEELSLSGINTGNILFGGINQFYIGRMAGGNSGTDFWYDDIYVRDALIGGFLGDVEVLGVELEDDFLTQWVRNTGLKNYLTLIENTPDEDVTFVSTDVTAKDLYEVQNSTFPGVIHAVQLVSRGRKTSTELWRLQNVVHVGGLELFGNQHYMSYPNYETFPPDVFGHQPNGSDWTLSAFNNMKVGIYAEPA